ncbi:camp-dependent protein kinase catalytic subunit [Moniliophthora roreri MCA 2997]|uniref:cAMP-dependent protein kinase n=2 Tax=Moniliophthora roreri TaxID=221103 RepID=V2WWK2_MONRO|nr:camp-dependent protein kinase catalytic subunit [Moniliophthora roreri MCA 2997]KAI3613557.1 camp-dependent protein kinase catalytic subunit [Moniliophthora roreri]
MSRASLGSLSIRRESPMPVVRNAPITPPMSPGNSEQDDDIVIDDDEDIIIEDDPTAPALPQHQLAEAQRPARLLEDETVHLQENGLKLTDFEVRGTLGTGTFGRVLLVRHRNPTAQNSHFALKVLRKSEIVRLRQVEHVNAERYILSRVQHPFIVDLFATFQDSLNVYMLMSYVPGGELFTHLRRAQRFTPDVTRFYLATIILALKYLHSFNIIYRDLKPENLLLDSRGYLRLTDFGFAKIVDDRTWTLCGTPEYLAPEIIQSDGHGKAADWWACGVLCYEMLVGYPPFYDESPYGIYEKILSGHIHWPRSMDPLSRSLIKAFLNPDRTQRLGNMIGGPQDILDHPWFRGVDWDLLERRGISAPIIPHTSSGDDTRHFLHLPFPPLEEMPGLLGEDPQQQSRQRLDPTSYQFLEF